MILAISLSMAVLLLWDFFIAGPQREAFEAARKEAIETAQTEDTAAGISGITVGAPELTIEDALATGPGRIPIRTETLVGSINLEGARIDDLQLLQFTEEVDPDSPKIRLLTPRSTNHAHYVQQGIIAGASSPENALWELTDGSVLTPTTPVTLSRQSGELQFEKTISIDDQYMFRVEQSVTNNSGEEISLTPFAIVVQRDIPEDYTNFFILHEGPLGIIGNALHERKYNTLKKKQDRAVSELGTGGWIGITNKYWLAAVIPPQDEQMDAKLENIGTTETPIFRSRYSLNGRNLAPGATTTIVSHVFGGVKDVDILQHYEKPVDQGGLNVRDFDKAVDWGHFFFLTRPIFYALDFFGDKTGSFGVAILILTVLTKLLLFPIANKGFEMTSKMKKMQPEVEALRARYEDDKMKMQQEMMALYKKEKLNPIAGCFPILLQMPIFYALYKTLFVTMEMRHQPFLYISDLSAPDPTTIFNLFGLLPYDPTALPMVGSFLAIGILPVLMGVAMWFQMKLNPPAADPIQAQIFALLPFFFVFIFAGFAAGLVLYWFWNTALSIVQQWYIMRRNGVELDWGDRFKFLKKKSPAPGE